MTDAHKDLKALGSSTVYKYDAPDATLLEAFPNPFLNLAQGGATSGRVHIEQPEFTSLCPMTGQPDFATIVIDYTPDKLCVESKALKLYLGSFRMHGSFHEQCVTTILNDLVALLQPLQIEVEGRFTPRGGIPFWPTVYWEK